MLKLFDIYSNFTEPFDLAFAIVIKCDTINTIVIIWIDASSVMCCVHPPSSTNAFLQLYSLPKKQINVS